MKNCQNCGTQNNDHAAFCGACGATLVTLQQESFNTNNYQNTQPNGYNGMPPQNYYGEQNGTYGTPPQNNGMPYGQNPYGTQGQYANQYAGFSTSAIVSLKKLCSSTLYLITAILFTIGFATSALTTIIIAPTNLIGLLSSGLTIAGIWLLYSYGKNAQSVSTQGLSLLKASLIIALVIMFLAVLVVLLLWLMAGALVGEIFGSSVGAGIIAIVAIMFLLVFGFAIAFYFAAIKCVDSIKKTVTTGVAHYGGITFVSVILFIVAVFGILSSFSSLLTLDSTNQMLYDLMGSMPTDIDIPMSAVESLTKIGPITLIASVLQNGAIFMLGLLLSKYRKEVK